MRVQVTDTGTGMSAEVLARAFEPFFTTKEIGRGTGLGLPQVLGFTKQSGGSVAVDSLPGHGTTVALYFPRDPDPDHGPGPAGADAPPQPGGHALDVLLVDDDPLLLRTLQVALAGAGHGVRLAAGGAEALSMLKAGRPVDVLLCDLVLAGGIGGAEVARAALRLRPSLSVLLASGYLPEALGIGGLPAGVDVLAKPFSPEELLRRIDALRGAVAAQGYTVS